MKRTERPEYERVCNEARSPFVFEMRKRFYAYEPRFHEEMKIKYIRSGALSVNLGSQVIVAEAGDLVIINPYEYHSNIVERGTVEYDMLCTDISDAYMGGILSELFHPYREGQYRFCNLIKDREVIERAMQLFRALEEKEDLISAIGRFALFFSSLGAYKEKPLTPGGKSYTARQREFLYAVFSFIHEKYAQSIRLPDLAGLCYMTEAHFCRTFKELVGEPPVSYINRYRINKATALMKAEELPLSELAARVGFSDVSYFSRLFKKYKGETPKGYRKELGAHRI